MERPKMENKVKLVVVKDKYSLIFQNSSGTSINIVELMSCIMLKASDSKYILNFGSMSWIPI